MQHFIGKVVLIVAIIATAVIPVAAQTPPAQKPSFDVASIKANASGDQRVGTFRQPGGRLVITGSSLKLLIGFAYVLQDFRIVGGPNWITTDRWNIEAKAEEGSIPQPSASPDSTAPDALMLMLQSLLEDRFQLKAHRETKELPEYDLVVSKDGPKFKLSDDQTSVRPLERGAPPPPQPQRGGPVAQSGMRVGRGVIGGKGVPVANLIGVLSSLFLGRQVIDKN